MRVNQYKARDGTRELMDGVAFVSSSLGGNFFFVVVDGGLDLLVWLGSVGSLWWHALLLFYWCTPHVIRYDTVCSRVSLCIILRYSTVVELLMAIDPSFTTSVGPSVASQKIQKTNEVWCMGLFLVSMMIPFVSPSRVG